MFRNCLIAISGLFAFSTAYAVCGENICADIFVDKLYVNSTGLIYVATSGTETNLSCTPESGIYLSLDPAAPNSDEVYSTLLAAQISGKLVSVRTQAGSSNCNILYITLTRQ